MPKYSFEVVEDDGIQRDAVHQNFKHVADAKTEACRAAGEIAAELFTKRATGSIAVEIKDHHGKPIARARVVFVCEDL